MTNRLSSAVLALGILAASGAVGAVTVDWTDWTTTSLTSASGTMGGVSVTVSADVMNGPSQTSCGGNYWTEPNLLDLPYTGGTAGNAPTPCEQVGLNSAARVTVTFGSAIDNLYMALLSVGQASYTVTYDFDQSFVIDSEGLGYWGNDVTNGIPGAGDTLAMQEFHGLLSFTSPVSSLSFTTAPDEYWHAFTFGSTASVPEPGTLALLGLSLVALVGARRRKH